MLQTSTVGWVSQLTEAGISSHDASVEVRQIILETLGMTPTQLLLHSGNLSAAEIRRIDVRIARRATREPLAYILGERWFYGMRFLVTPDVLIPRPETELLVELALAHVQQCTTENPSILDLCTGSGCLAILLAKRFPKAHVHATDLSAKALEVAALNVADHKLAKRITLHETDTMTALTKGPKFDLILSNPPYVDAADLASMPAEYRHEPERALGSGEDGLDLVRRMLAEAADHLTEKGVLIVEVGNSQVHVEALYPEVDFTWLEFERGGHGVFLLAAAQCREHQALFRQRLQG